MQNPKTKKKKIYGLELILELFDCKLELISSKIRIQRFINQILKIIKMEKYGPSFIKRYMGGGLFGMGYSFFQFITSSSITGHFLEKEKIAFINIFSCELFNSEKAANFTKKFFKAKKIKKRIIFH